MISTRRESLVVIGNGMAGARAVEEILRRSPDRYTITMFGDEPHGNYNRIQLSTVLGGFSDPEKILLNPLDWYQRNEIRLHAGVRAERIDRRDHVVFGRGRSGHNGSARQIELAEPYHKLIIATGSRPFVPPLHGTRQDWRVRLSHARRLLANRRRCPAGEASRRHRRRPLGARSGPRALELWRRSDGRRGRTASHGAAARSGGRRRLAAKDGIARGPRARRQAGR